VAQPSEAIQCPQCMHSNPPGSLCCKHCNTSFSDTSETVMIEGETGWSRALTGAIASASPGSLRAGEIVARRYEILKVLGEGGMGTVYMAMDREVDRVVALKVIRSDLAGQTRILERFKQELILTRQVTHKNVIRIFDLGSDGPLRFITMEYVEGRDLSSLLREGRLPVEETTRIIRQVCSALEAAHAESVVHRDLKPQNIMLNDRGKVSVMDFGLAFSTEMSGLTQTGMLLGTPAYMSPEQAQGKTVDARSDLYALGIILYEMLTGEVPFQADSMIASLMKRTQGPPPPPTTLNTEVPKALSDAVLKCLAVNPADRYQSATEMLRGLDMLARDSAASASPSMAQLMSEVDALPQKHTWKWVSAGLAASLAMVLVLGFAFRDRFTSRPPSKNKTVRVLVADFTNATGDSVFENTLESMFNIAMEGAAFVNAYDRGQARRIAAQIQPNATRLDESLARLVALHEGIEVVISGSIARRGDGYDVSVRAIDSASGKRIASQDSRASSREAVLSAVPRLAAPIRKTLGDATPESAQLAAAGGTLGASSLEAVHQYGLAMEQQFAGKMEQALQSFSKAAELDPHFARAYSGMAAVSGNMGQLKDAEKYIQLALQNIGRMTDRERLRTRGLYYARTHDLQKCVEEYSELVKQYPADNIGHNNLANCLSQLRNMSRAVEEARLAVQIVPKSAAARNNLSLFASYSGDFQTGEREALAVQQINRAYVKGYIALAFAHIGQDHIPQAQEAYTQLEKINPSWAASGLADQALYEGRFKDSARLLETAAAADVTANHLEAAAEKFVALAYTELVSKQTKAAVGAAAKALSYSKAVKIRFLVARIFVEAGNEAARSLATGLSSELQAEPQAYGKLIEGEAALKDRNAQQAIKVVTEANALLDTWIGHFDLGRAYLSAGLFAQADGEFDKCIKRRGEALSLFADESPTYGYLPPVYYYQGLVREGLKSPDFAGAYRTYLGIRGKPGEDPLLDEVRRRAGESK
jgi:serine/threonine protein kinase/tetratricopeptide (TPR) repeat protein